MNISSTAVAGKRVGDVGGSLGVPGEGPRACAAGVTVAVHFVASPLQYLAARRIAQVYEADARNVLIWYQPGVGRVVRPDEWDASAYMPWPRHDPLPGLLGRHRRLRDNIRRVATLIGRCDTLHLHSAVFDTEAINYFLRALPQACGARTMRARILPDGVISLQRYPLSRAKRALQWLRKLRRVLAPELDYWCFGGDRIGSDAPFCDRIYVLLGLPHEYPVERVVTLPPLVDVPTEGVPNDVPGRLAAMADSAVGPDAADRARQPVKAASRPRRALVVGQPLAGAGLMAPQDRDAVSAEIREWLAGQGFYAIDYKGHPKDPQRELCEPAYRVLEIDEPLETWIARERYDAIVGVRSSALLFARQVLPRQVIVRAFGWDRVRFKSDAEQASLRRAFGGLGVELA